jgi:hypothetical protein
MTQSLRRIPKRFALILGFVTTAACTGENLFTVSSSANALGPSINITAPTAGFTIALGDSIRVAATGSAPSGATTVAYRGEYATMAQAFVAETQAIPGGETQPVLTNYLQAGAGQVAGAAWIIVMLTDALGGTATDSVSITITN